MIFAQIVLHNTVACRLCKFRWFCLYVHWLLIVSPGTPKHVLSVGHDSSANLDRSRYNNQLHLCNRMMSKSKSDYYTSLLSNNSANPRQMWNSVNKILHREKSKPLPDHTSLDTLCSSFSKFFTDTITLIRSNVVTNDHSHNFHEPTHVENTMDQFTPTTTSEVRSIILKSTKCRVRSWPISNTSSQTLYRWSNCSYHWYH